MEISFIAFKGALKSVAKREEAMETKGVGHGMQVSAWATHVGKRRFSRGRLGGTCTQCVRFFRICKGK
jgi:hypothetical protein